MKKQIIIFIILLLIFSGANLMSQKKDKVYEIFISEIKKYGYSVKERISENLIKIYKNNNTYDINLENIRKNYLRDNNPQPIYSLVENVINLEFVFPSWKESKGKIYFTAEPSDMDFKDMDFKDNIFEKITDEFNKVYVYYNEKKIIFINKADLKRWGIILNDLLNAANDNMKSEIEKTNFDKINVDGHDAFYFDSDLPFKSSMILSKNFKVNVIKKIGWPVYCVIPVRDFTYIFAEKDKDFFIKRLGTVVVNEYNNSGYPITTEVLKIDDKGISAIGKYPNPKK